MERHAACPFRHGLQHPDPGYLRGPQLRAAGARRRVDHAVFHRTHSRSAQRRGSGARMALTILTLSFTLLLLLGVPVAFAIGLSAVCTIFYEGLPLAVVFQQMRAGMNVFS